MSSSRSSLFLPAGARVRECSPVSARPGVSAEHWTYKLLRGPGDSLSFLNFRARTRNCRARSWSEENMMINNHSSFWYHDKNNVSWAVTKKENIVLVAKPGLYSCVKSKLDQAFVVFQVPTTPKEKTQNRCSSILRLQMTVTHLQCVLVMVPGAFAVSSYDPECCICSLSL